MTIIGILFIAFGALSIGVGVKTKPTGMKSIIGGILLAVGGLFVAIADNLSNGGIALTVLGFLMSAAGLVFTGIDIVKSFTDAKEKKLAEFYDACIESGITECVGEKAIQKATLLAKQKNISFTDIAVLYQQAKDAKEKIDRKQHQDRLETRKKAETERMLSLNRFADVTGREKRVSMLQYLRDKALAEAAGTNAGTQSFLKAIQKKELNTATHAGIANGLAGPVAGVAAALDVQAKNEQIRAQNAANLKTYAPLISNRRHQAHVAAKRAEELKGKIEEAKTKLVADDSTASCMERLQFTNTIVTVSETGTCDVRTTVNLNAPFRIFDDVDAVVDGTLVAHIYDGETLIGDAKLVLPEYGVGTGTERLYGLCLFRGKHGANYSVRIEPIKLWAMEK